MKQAIDQVLHIYQRLKEQEHGKCGQETQEPIRREQYTDKHVFLLNGEREDRLRRNTNLKAENAFQWKCDLSVCRCVRKLLKNENPFFSSQEKKKRKQTFSFTFIGHLWMGG